MPTITIDDTDITPDLLEEASVSSQSNTRLHELVGGGRQYTLRPAAPRMGRLRLLFADRSTAWDCYELHRGASVAVLDDDENPERSMSYVVSGVVEPELDDTTREHWHVSIDYAEVIP